jgi:hypothetical protein
VRLLWKNIGIAVAAVALCALGWFELVADWRTPRSDFVQSHAIGANVSTSLVKYNALVKEMKQQHGERTNVSLEFPGARMRVEQDGKTIREETLAQKFSDVIGMFMVGRRGRATDMLFPFRLAPDQDLNRVEHTLAAAIRGRFGKGLPQRWTSFTDQDWSIGECIHLPSGLGLGGVGLLIGLRKGTACVVTWRRPQPVSMLVSVNLAQGDPWLRPFSRRLCRAITETALAQIDRGEANRPAYAACILADRPDRKGAKDMLTSHAYSVGPGGRLALMD